MSNPSFIIYYFIYNCEVIIIRKDSFKLINKLFHFSRSLLKIIYYLVINCSNFFKYKSYKKVSSRSYFVFIEDLRICHKNHIRFHLNKKVKTDNKY